MRGVELKQKPCAHSILHPLDHVMVITIRTDGDSE